MNGNRTRYSSTPTFNMQKRGLFKKSPSFAPDKPDFSAAPEPIPRKLYLARPVLCKPSPCRDLPIPLRQTCFLHLLQTITP